MRRVRVIPTLLLRNAGLVKTVKFKDPTYIGDPINAVKIFNEKEVDELVFLDITATTAGKKPPFSMIKDIASECFMPLGYGGGIQNLDDVQHILHLGVEKVIIGNYAVERPEFIREAARIVGSQSVVACLDVKKSLLGRYSVHVKNGTVNTHLDPCEFARKLEDMGVGEILLYSIDRDGVMKGYDIELIKRVSSVVSVPVVACGGAGSVADLQAAVLEGGASAVSAGSMFVFHGKHRAVLINFPTPAQLDSALVTNDSRPLAVNN